MFSLHIYLPVDIAHPFQGLQYTRDNEWSHTKADNILWDSPYNHGFHRQNKSQVNTELEKNKIKKLCIVLFAIWFSAL